MIFSRVLNVYVLAIGLPFLAFTPEAVAQEDQLGAYNQKLGDKWMNASLPDHLHSRRAGEEVLYSGNLVPEDVARKILEADTRRPVRKMSELVNPSLYSSLQRQMKSQHLIELIKSGQLVPRSYQVGSNDEETSLKGVYLELHRVNHPKPFAWDDVELHFDYSVLDRTDYIVNPFWGFGQYGPLTASAELNPGRLAYYIESYLAQGEKNEIVFLNAVPFSKVKTIVVPAGKRKALLAKIRASGVTCPQPGGCDAILIERP